MKKTLRDYLGLSGSFMTAFCIIDLLALYYNVSGGFLMAIGAISLATALWCFVARVMRSPR